MVGAASSFKVVQYVDANVSPGCTTGTRQSVIAYMCTSKGSMLSKGLARTSVTKTHLVGSHRFWPEAKGLLH